MSKAPEHASWSGAALRFFATTASGLALVALLWAWLADRTWNTLTLVWVAWQSLPFLVVGLASLSRALASEIVAIAYAIAVAIVVGSYFIVGHSSDPFAVILLFFAPIVATIFSVMALATGEATNF